MERTHHNTQSDEHLRRALLDEQTRAGLAWIANRLTTTRPRAVMTDNARHAAALRYALDTCPDDTDAIALQHALLQRLPAVEDEPTRAAYAVTIPGVRQEPRP